MAIDAIARAYYDRERARLGLPTRVEEEALRQKRELAARLGESELETEAVGRERDRAEIAALPAEQDLQRRVREAQIRNYDETAQPRAEPSSQLERILALPPDQQAAAIRLHREMNPSGGQAQRDPWSGWKEIYDPASGKFIGFAHPASGFKPAAGIGIPEGGKPGAITAGERTSLALGSMGVRAGDNMRRALAATRTAEKESPLSPGTMTGPIAGRVGSVYRDLVSSAGPGGDFDQARLEGRTIVYDLSGKQLNESELEWLDSMLPRLTDKGVDQQIERFERFVTAIRKAKAAGYSDPFTVARQTFDQTLPSAAGDQLRLQGEGVVDSGTPPAAPRKSKYKVVQRPQ